MILPFPHRGPSSPRRHTRTLQGQPPQQPPRNRRPSPRPRGLPPHEHSHAEPHAKHPRRRPAPAPRRGSTAALSPHQLDLRGSPRRQNPVHQGRSPHPIHQADARSLAHHAYAGVTSRTPRRKALHTRVARPPPRHQRCRSTNSRTRRASCQTGGDSAKTSALPRGALRHPRPRLPARATRRDRYSNPRHAP